MSSGSFNDKVDHPYVRSSGNGRFSTLTITAKGQVTLRKELLAHLNVAPGQKVTVSKLPDGGIEVRAAATGRIADALDCLKSQDGPVLTLDEIAAVALQGWAARR